MKSGAAFDRFPHLMLIAHCPRRATDLNDPMLYTFVPKLRGSGNKAGLTPFGRGYKNQEKKALPWNVSVVFCFFHYNINCK